MANCITPLPLQRPPLPPVRPADDPLTLHVRDRNDPHKTRDLIAGDLAKKADLVGGKVPASQLPDVAVPQPSDAAPSAPAARPSPGVSGQYARGDHVHPKDPDKADRTDLAWERGDGSGSARLKAGDQSPDNAALSEAAVAEGRGTLAGQWAFHYTAMTPNSLTFDADMEASGWSAGDNVNVVNKSVYVKAGVIASISGHVVTFEENLPFASIEPDAGLDAQLAYVSTSPSSGDTELGYGAHAEGAETQAKNYGAHAEGLQTKALGKASHAEGYGTWAQYAAHSEGRDTRALGEQSHAEGKTTHAEGVGAHSEGLDTRANGDESHAEGAKTVADGVAAHAEGGMRIESNGTLTKQGTAASGVSSHAEGCNTAAAGNYAHAEGQTTSAAGPASHAEGFNTETKNYNEHAEGRYNASHQDNPDARDSAGNTTHSIGIGSATNRRANAFEVMQNGDVYVKGLGGYDGTNPGAGRDLVSAVGHRVLFILDQGYDANDIAVGGAGGQVVIPYDTIRKSAVAYLGDENGGILRQIFFFVPCVTRIRVTRNHIENTLYVNGVAAPFDEDIPITADSTVSVHYASCLGPDTPILMADGTERRLADVSPGDEVDTPFGPDRVVSVPSGEGPRRDTWEFTDGVVVRTVGRHRFYNRDVGECVYLEAWNAGERAIRRDGSFVSLVRRTTEEGRFAYATLFTEKWNVYYAAGMLAGNRKSKLPAWLAGVGGAI